MTQNVGRVARRERGAKDASLCEALRELRLLREETALRHARAADYLALATRGMSRREATDRSGTGRCPLTDYALCYAGERDAAREAKRRADALWLALLPRVNALPDGHARVLIQRYHNQGLDWATVCADLGGTQAECLSLLRAALETPGRRGGRRA